MWWWWQVWQEMRGCLSSSEKLIISTPNGPTAWQKYLEFMLFCKLSFCPNLMTRIFEPLSFSLGMYFWKSFFNCYSDSLVMNAHGSSANLAYLPFSPAQYVRWVLNFGIKLWNKTAISPAYFPLTQSSFKDTAISLCIPIFCKMLPTYSTFKSNGFKYSSSWHFWSNIVSRNFGQFVSECRARTKSKLWVNN